MTAEMKGRVGKGRSNDFMSRRWPEKSSLFAAFLKRPQVIETKAFPRIVHVLITGKITRVIIHVGQYLNFN